MYSFDDSLDELGEDFGLFNTPSFVRYKYEDLDRQWASLIAPYKGLGTGTSIPPEKLLANYRAWQRVYQEFKDGWLNALWAGGSISIWKSEVQRYKRTYDYLEEMFRLNAGPQQILTPSPRSSGATEPNIMLPPDSTINNQSPGARDNSLFAGVNWNIGTIAVLSIAGLFAYNVFFRLRERGKGRIS